MFEVLFSFVVFLGMFSRWQSGIHVRTSGGVIEGNDLGLIEPEICCYRIMKLLKFIENRFIVNSFCRFECNLCFLQSDGADNS